MKWVCVLCCVMVAACVAFNAWAYAMGDQWYSLVFGGFCLLMFLWTTYNTIAVFKTDREIKDLEDRH